MVAYEIVVFMIQETSPLSHHAASLRLKFIYSSLQVFPSASSVSPQLYQLICEILWYVSSRSKTPSMSFIACGSSHVPCHGIHIPPTSFYKSIPSGG